MPKFNIDHLPEHERNLIHDPEQALEKTRAFAPYLRAGSESFKRGFDFWGNGDPHYERELAALRAFYPNAQEKDWRLEEAGQRVQIIKKDPVHGGILQFGTELVGANHLLSPKP